jgi:hypothetical protein
MAKKEAAPTEEDGVITGDAPETPTGARVLAVGTVLKLHNADVRLEAPGTVMINNAPISDDGLAGLLASSGADNFRLNAGLFGKKRYNPSTGARVPNECADCGTAIDDEAEKCDDCIAAENAKAEAAKTTKKK